MNGEKTKEPGRCSLLKEVIMYNLFLIWGGRMNGNLENVNWVDRLIFEYTEGRKLLKVKSATSNEVDRKRINSMINEMSDVIKWLKTGKDPYKFKSNERKSAYQRRVILDMDLFPSLDILPESYENTESGALTESQKELVAEILIELSWRERQCYLLHIANERTFQEISIELGITKSSVQSYIDRAKKKVSKKMSCHTDAM